MSPAPQYWLMKMAPPADRAKAEQLEEEGKAVGLRDGGVGSVAQAGHHQAVDDVQAGALPAPA